MAALKGELDQLLQQPLVARGVLASYITSGSRPIVADLISGAGEQAFDAPHLMEKLTNLEPQVILE